MNRAAPVGIRVLCSLALGATLPLAACAQVTTQPAMPAPAASAASPAQAQLVQQVAAATGKSPAQLNALLDSAVVQPSILAAMERPAEKASWSHYRPIFVNPTRIQQGIAFYQRHRALLERIAQRYGVPPQYIVAIIGVETNYGANTGHYRVLDALVTLAFHYPPRAAFFQGELKSLLELPASKLAAPVPQLYGSYAGAMGLGQFMPSAIAKYAVDGDGDGRINLMGSLPDSFASIANYFRMHGWQPGQPIAARVTRGPNAAAPAAYTRSPPVTPARQLIAAGYTPVGHVDAALPARMLTLDGPGDASYWLTFQNFYVITAYNHSPMYAMAVNELAAAIAHGAAGR